MARPNSTTMLNRAALDAITLGLADGMGTMGQRVLSAAEPKVPDAPPYGQGLIDTGDFGVWVHGKKVAGGARKVPRQVGKDGIVLLAGYDWPGHYAEGGTIHEPARPFLTPAFMEVIGETEGVLQDAVAPYLARAK